MKKLIATVAVAFALSLAGPLVTSDHAEAKAAKAVAKVCKSGKGKTAQTWKCEPGQACCVGPDGKGVCGIQGLGCI